MMTEASSVPAARLRKPSWRDPRLLIGLLLVVASVVSVVALVGAADSTIEVYAAKESISVGQKVTVDSLVKVRVRLGDAEGAYLVGSAEVPADVVALRLLPKGELVARSLLGRADALDRKPAALTIDQPLPKDAVVGSRVDVWVSLPDAHNGFAEAKKMLTGAEIAELTQASTALGGSKSTQLQVLVSESELPPLLSALANKAKVAVVWNPGGKA